MKATIQNGKINLYPDPGDPTGLPELWLIQRRRLERRLKGTWSANTDAFYAAQAAAEIGTARVRWYAEQNRTKLAHAIPAAEIERRVSEFVRRREAGEGPALKVYQSAGVWDTTANHVHKEFRAELARRGKLGLLSNGKRGRPKKSPAR